MIDQYPLTAYRFVVTLNPGDAYLPPAQASQVTMFANGEFQEVKGLGADLEVTSYAEGGSNDFLYQLPVRHSWSRITLKRGLVRDRGLWDWYVAGLTQSLGARRDGSIILLDTEGNHAVSWEFRGGLAVKWLGPELNAMQSAVAFEGLEIAHQGIRQVKSAGNLLDLVLSLF
jgi:phage tail-like protein